MLFFFSLRTSDFLRQVRHVFKGKDRCFWAKTSGFRFRTVFLVVGKVFLGL